MFDAGSKGHCFVNNKRQPGNPECLGSLTLTEKFNNGSQKGALKISTGEGDLINLYGGVKVLWGSSIAILMATISNKNPLLWA